MKLKSSLIVLVFTLILSAAIYYGVFYFNNSLQLSTRVVELTYLRDNLKVNLSHAQLEIKSLQKKLLAKANELAEAKLKIQEIDTKLNQSLTNIDTLTRQLLAADKIKNTLENQLSRVKSNIDALTINAEKILQQAGNIVLTKNSTALSKSNTSSPDKSAAIEKTLIDKNNELQVKITEAQQSRDNLQKSVEQFSRIAAEKENELILARKETQALREQLTQVTGKYDNLNHDVQTKIEVLEKLPITIEQIDNTFSKEFYQLSEKEKAEFLKQLVEQEMGKQVGVILNPVVESE